MTNRFSSIQEIATEFDALIPSIAENFESVVTSLLADILTKYGSEARGEINKLSNRYDYDAAVWRQFRDFTVTVDVNGNKSHIVRAEGDKYLINYDRIKRSAIKYAQAEVDKFKFKLVNKLEDLENISNLRIRSGEFSFDATLNDYSVRVKQTTVFKTSSKGKLFNQWPCRIYVNNRFISEAKFKKLQSEIKETI